MILLTCVLGFVVSLTTFLAIGASSSAAYNGGCPFPPVVALEMQVGCTAPGKLSVSEGKHCSAVVGHVKTVLVLTGGCLLFGDQMSPKRFAGICLALGGIFWYSFLKLKVTTLSLSISVTLLDCQKPNHLSAKE